HMGHALNNTLQDILTRWKRMDGYNDLWMPGMDHAGIATQNVVEKMLAKEGINRHEIGRDKFIEKVWEWKEESGGTILSQLKRLGSSCDWDRARFTMDEGLSKAVREVFVRLYDEGLIYKGDRLINWCPRCHTALSDLEVEHEEERGFLYNIKYPIIDKSGHPSGDYLVVATTRPETMFGDTAVAVNPNDERYAKFIGREVLLPLTDRKIPIIGDEYVDMEFGTGALKITPAHDFNDFEIGTKHNLPIVKVIDHDGKMMDGAGKYNGLDRFDCRKKVSEELKENGYLISQDDYNNAVGRCYRCNTVVEPHMSQQWFVNIKPMAEEAIKVVRNGQIEIVPKGWENTYFDWMENIKDWCISRQIWWGHRIPAWICEDCGKLTVSKEDPTACSHCDSSKIYQETDVLDTWFSSALWPFSTLGWPENSEALKTFYPTDVLITGFDIIFFWVARMIMSGLKFMGDVPFKTVYIHALVRDVEGQKMSKSKGNVIDPLVIIDEYGADTLRFTLTALAAHGRDIKLSTERIEGYRNFVNKIWNAFRFASMNLEGYSDIPDEEYLMRLDLETADRWILSRLQDTTAEVRKSLEEYRFNDAAQAIYLFFWHELCDWYIELIKLRLRGEGEDKKSAQSVLTYVLARSLSLLHPIMPFITEELWQKLPHQGESIMIAPYPKFNESLYDESSEREMGVMMDICRAIRNVRSEMSIPPGLRLKTIIRSETEEKKEIAQKHAASIIDMARLESLDISVGGQAPKMSLTAVINQMDIFVLIEGVIDVKEEENRLNKELAKIDKEIVAIDKKLSNASFVDKAPEDVVEKNRARLLDYRTDREKIEGNLERLKALA
ncbi:MAG: valine--tRNA ligase, partial [Nitrospinota bacterium]